MGYYKRYSYTVATVAQLALTSEANVRQHIRRGNLDMESLISVFKFIRKRNPLAFK